jgi:hypothetical protein
VYLINREELMMDSELHNSLLNLKMICKLCCIRISCATKSSRLYTILAIDPKYDKLITSLRTAYAEELNLKKDIGSYSDLLDALRLSLKGYNIE